jgi:ketosteroid isomerase-like protein
MFRLNSQVRKASATLALTFCLSLLVLIGCNQTAPDTRAADENELRELDAQWSKAAGARDLDATVTYYADDAVVMPGDAPIANTKQTIRDLWGPMMAPNISVSWQVNQAEVARSGDLGYARGVYQLVTKDAAGKTTTERGKLLEVWKKQSDGKWKCVIDNFSADAPPVSPAPENNK